MLQTFSKVLNKPVQFIDCAETDMKNALEAQHVLNQYIEALLELDAIQQGRQICRGDFDG